MGDAELLRRHRAVMPSWLTLFYEQPIEIVSGSGRRVTDGEGRRYLDFWGGILTNAIGYDIAEISDAVRRQVDSGVVHTSTLYLIRAQVDLAEKISRLSGIPDAKVFFCNSGSEANDTALTAGHQPPRVPARCWPCATPTTAAGSATIAVTGNRGWSATPLSALPGRLRRRAATAIAARTGTSTTTPTSRPASTTCARPSPPPPAGDDRLRCSPSRSRAWAASRRAPTASSGRSPRWWPTTAGCSSSDEVQTGWGRTGDHFWGFQAHGVDAGPDHIRQGHGQRARHRGRGRPRGHHGGGPHQLDLDLRRQPALDLRRQRHDRLPARPRPASQCGQAGRPAAVGPARPRRHPRGGRGRARPGPDAGARAGRGRGRATRPGRRRASCWRRPGSGGCWSARVACTAT